MPMKELLNRLRPVQLYIVLILSIVYFLVQLFLSHITHALTLLVDSYHMLCNIIALSGCILTIKHSNKKISYQQQNDSEELSKEESRFVELCTEQKQKHHHQQHEHTNRSHNHNHELKLRNTFGWTRIDILTMLIVCIFLASLSFSLLVEALQTLIHIDHQDTMHLPIPVLILGGIGLILNGLCYLLIGGYTLHQGSFLQITSSGDVILDSRITSSDECLKPGERRLSRTKRETQNQQQQQQQQQSSSNEIISNNDIHHHYHQQQQGRKRQGFMEMFRDISSTLFVICCAIIIYVADDEQVTKYVDPIISIFSCIVLLLLSYPYMKESCLILLQTMPASIDIEIFKQTLLSTFTDIVSVHDLHIWQLTSSRYVSTAHIIFQNPLVYAHIMNDVKNFFYEQGINIVTIQPEFKSTKMPLPEECLVQCNDVECIEKHCCRRQTIILSEIVTIKNDKHSFIQNQEKEQQKLQKEQLQQHKLKFDSLLSNTKLLKRIVEKSKSTNNLNNISTNLDETTENITKFNSEPQLMINHITSFNVDKNNENQQNNFDTENTRYCGQD